MQSAYFSLSFVTWPILIMVSRLFSQALLIKEYGGRTVVFRVPTEKGEAAGDGEQVGEDGAEASR